VKSWDALTPPADASFSRGFLHAIDYALPSDRTNMPAVLPCHLAAEMHFGVAVELPRGFVGIYQCRGQYWSVPLDLMQVILAGQLNTIPPLLNAVTMTTWRQSLGPVSLGHDAIASHLATAPDTVTVNDDLYDRGVLRYFENDWTLPPLPAGDTSTGMDDDSLRDWVNNEYPATAEAELLGHFGVDMSLAVDGRTKFRPVVYAMPEIGIGLAEMSGDGPYIRLVAETEPDDPLDDPDWVLLHIAKDENGKADITPWGLLPVGADPDELSLMVELILTEIPTHIPEMADVARMAYITWCAVTAQKGKVIAGLEQIQTTPYQRLEMREIPRHLRDRGAVFTEHDIDVFRRHGLWD